MNDDPQVPLQILEDPYKLTSATAGEDAFEELTPETDVVILDRRMPGMSGDEGLEVIRERGFDCRGISYESLPPAPLLTEGPTIQCSRLLAFETTHREWTSTKGVCIAP